MSAGSSGRSRRDDGHEEFTDMLTSPSGAILRPSMSRTKMVKTINRLLYRGDVRALRRMVREDRDAVQRCLPFVARQFRETVKMYLEE